MDWSPPSSSKLSGAETRADASADAGPTIRRQTNRAIFKRADVGSEDGVTSEFSERFELLLSSEVTEAARDHA